MATATYTVVDANCDGWHGYTASTAPANGGALTTETQLTAPPGEKTKITGSDNNTTSWTKGANQRPGIRLSLRVTQTVATITKITVAGEGYGSTVALFTVWVKNVNTPAWESIGSHANAGDTVITGDKTVNLANYFDADKDIEMLITGGIAVPQPTTVVVDDAYVIITCNAATPRSQGLIIG